MADHPRHPDTDDQVGVGPDREYTTSTSWRTYAFVFIAIVLVLGLVVLHLTGIVGPGTN